MPPFENMDDRLARFTGLARRGWAQPSSASSASGFPDLMTMNRTILSGAYGQGAFDPSFLRNLLRRAAIARAGARRSRGAVTARLAGLDPMATRDALFDVERDASGDLSDALTQADIAGGQDWLSMIRSLLASERDDEQGLFREREQRRWEESQQGGLGGFLGDVLGAGIGAFTGGYASERGRRAGGGR